MKAKLSIQLIISVITLMITVVMLYNFGIGLDELYSLNEFANEGNLMYVWAMFGLSILSIIINFAGLAKKIVIHLREKVGKE